jgi:hypothetical protein
VTIWSRRMMVCLLKLPHPRSWCSGNIFCPICIRCRSFSLFVIKTFYHIILFMAWHSLRTSR